MLAEMNAAQQHRTEPTSIERIGYGLLNEMALRYEAQHLIGGKFCVDAFLPECGLVIEFDGDYWHANPTKFSQPDERQRRQIRLDKSRDAYLEACGYGVLRFWGSELQGDLGAVAGGIKFEIAERLKLMDA